MDDKDWYMLKTLYEEKNVTRSAERLLISQPALTYRLRQIEEDFSIKIFSRSKTGIKFTTEGEHLVDYANQMIVHQRKFRDRLLEIDNNAQVELRIGVSSNYAHYKLPDILEEFLQHYPDTQIKVNTGWSRDILDLFKNEEVHIGIIRGDYEWDGPKLLMNEDPMCLISKDPINMHELPNLPRISYKTDPNLEQLLDSWWREKYSQPPLINMEVDKLETCKEMVKKGLGYGIIPHYILKKEDHNLFVQNIKTKNNTFIYRKLWMFYRVDEMSLSVVKAFVSFINLLDKNTK
jgi:DNA-binding transcriptional LysR family regulator